MTATDIGIKLLSLAISSSMFIEIKIMRCAININNIIKQYQRNGLQDGLTEDFGMAFHSVLHNHNYLGTRLLEDVVSPPHHLLHVMACR